MFLTLKLHRYPPYNPPKASKHPIIEDYINRDKDNTLILYLGDQLFIFDHNYTNYDNMNYLRNMLVLFPKGDFSPDNHVELSFTSLIDSLTICKRTHQPYCENYITSIMGMSLLLVEPAVYFIKMLITALYCVVQMQILQNYFQLKNQIYFEKSGSNNIGVKVLLI